MRVTSLRSLVVALAVVIGVPAGVGANPFSPAAAALGSAAATDGNFEWGAKRGSAKKGKHFKVKHFKGKRAGKHRRAYRTRFAHPRRAHYRRAYHRRFHRPRIYRAVYVGRRHFHCHRHYRIRHCHWHRPGHHR